MQITNATNAFVNTTNRNTGGRVPSFPQGNVPLTRTPLQRSEEEVINDIKKLAEKFAAAGMSFYEAREMSDFRNLRSEFVSPYSPDRAGAVNSKLQSLGQQMGVMGIRFTLANFFLVLFQNSPLLGSQDIGANFVRFRDSGGNVVAGFNSETGWDSFFCLKEAARINEFNEIFRRELAHAEAVLSGEFQMKKENLTNDLFRMIGAGIIPDLQLAYDHPRVNPVDWDLLARSGVTLNTETQQSEVDWEKWKASGRELPDTITHLKDWNVNGILDIVASGQEVNIAFVPGNEAVNGLHNMVLNRLAANGVTFDSVTGEAVVDWDRLASTGRQVNPGASGQQTKAQQMAEQRYALYAASL